MNPYESPENYDPPKKPSREISLALGTIIAILGIILYSVSHWMIYCSPEIYVYAHKTMLVSLGFLMFGSYSVINNL